MIQECFTNTRWSTTYLKFIPLCCKVSVTCYSQTKIPYELQRIRFLSALQFLVKSCTFVWWKLCVPSADFVPWDWSLLLMTTRLRQASYFGMTETLEVFLRDLLLIKSYFFVSYSSLSETKLYLMRAQQYGCFSSSPKFRFLLIHPMFTLKNIFFKKIFIRTKCIYVSLKIFTWQEQL